MTEPENKLTHAQWVLEKQLNWIASAEVKIGLVVTLNIAMLSGLGAFFMEAETRIDWDYFFTGLAVLLPLIAISICAAAMLPRLDGPVHSRIYFGRIAFTDRPTYVEEFRGASDADFLKDLLEQSHRNAEIACKKHQLVRKAMGCSFGAVLLWLVAILALSL